MSGSTQPQLSPEIAGLICQAMPWDGAGRKREYVLGCRRRHFRVSESAYYILQCVMSGNTFEQIAGAINAQSAGTSITEEQVESAYLRIIAQLELDDDADVEPKAFGFWGKRRLFSKELVIAVARPMAVFYSRWPAALLILFILCVSGFALHSGLAGIPPGSYWAAYLLFIVSLFFHEFGHASACSRFGQEPNEIGFTVYLIYPSLYSNVTSAWRLKRWQRVVVDAGGNFFQLITGSIYMVLYWFMGWNALRLSFLMILLSVAFSLNPLFKFDGYWILSDFLGIANLHKQVPLIFSHFFNRFLGRPVSALQWPGKVVAALIVYSVCASVAWGLFTFRLLRSVPAVLARLPHAFTSVCTSLFAGTLPSMNEARPCLMAALLLPLPGMILLQIVKRLWRWQRPPSKATLGRGLSKDLI